MWHARPGKQSRRAVAGSSPICLLLPRELDRRGVLFAKVKCVVGFCFENSRSYQLPLLAPPAAVRAIVRFRCVGCLFGCGCVARRESVHVHLMCVCAVRVCARARVRERQREAKGVRERLQGMSVPKDKKQWCSTHQHDVGHDSRECICVRLCLCLSMSVSMSLCVVCQCLTNRHTDAQTHIHAIVYSHRSTFLLSESQLLRCESCRESLAALSWASASSGGLLPPVTSCVYRVLILQAHSGCRKDGDFCGQHTASRAHSLSQSSPARPSARERHRRYRVLVRMRSSRKRCGN
jgi:hypothetical protein